MVDRRDRRGGAMRRALGTGALRTDIGRFVRPVRSLSGEGVTFQKQSSDSGGIADDRCGRSWRGQFPDALMRAQAG
jgi:hypothetical protein